MQDVNCSIYVLYLRGQLSQFFRDGFGTPKHPKWTSLGHYITTRQESNFSKSTSETLEHEVNYVQS